MVGKTGDPRILILDALTPFGVSVKCRESVRPRALRSGQVGPSDMVNLMVDNTA